MAVKSNHKLMLKKLKKQVRLLQRKEEKSKDQLKNSLQKIRKLHRSYQKKLTEKNRLMKNKVAEMQATTYAKAAHQIEKQIMKGINAKSRALETVLSRLEKKHAAKLKKGIAKKGKKVVKKSEANTKTLKSFKKRSLSRRIKK